MIKYKVILLILLFTCYLSALHAQVWPGPHPLLSSWIKITTENKIAGQVDTLEKKFGFNRGEAAVNIPVYRGKDWLTATGNTPLTGITIHGAASYLQPRGGFIPDDIQLLRLRAGANFIYSKGLRNLFMGNVQAVNAGASNNISLAGTYANGSLFWRHRRNDQFSYTLGAAYTSAFGSNRILPLLGVNWRPLKEDLISILLPVYIQYTHFFSRSFSAGFSVRPFGGLYYFDYPVNDSIVIENVKFRHREFQAALKMRIKLSYQLSLEPDFGISGKTLLKINDAEYKSAESVFIRLMIRYKFGKRANVAPILDFDPADFINADPEIPEN